MTPSLYTGLWAKPYTRERSLLRDAMNKRGVCRHVVSVRHSVTFVNSAETSNRIVRLFSQSGTTPF